MRRIRVLAVVLSTVGCVVVVGGCSDDSDTGPAVKGEGRQPVVLTPEATRVPQKASDVAIVEDGKVSFPSNATTKEYAASLKPGAIMAGNRDLSTADLGSSKNPYGFLRKVVSVDDSSDPIVVKTEQAYLPDLLEGDLHWGDKPSPSIFTDADDDTTSGKSIHPLAELGGASVGSGTAPLVGELKQTALVIVKLSNGQFGLDAEFDADFKIRRWWRIPTGIERAMAKLTLNPRASVDLEVGAQIRSTPENMNKTWEGPSLPIPLGGPIPLTLRLRPEVTCQVYATGEITLRGRPNLTGRAAAGFEYTNGELRNLYEAPSLTPGFQFIGVQGQASLVGSCTIQGVVSLLAFDAVGVEGKLGPYISLNATLCAAGGSGGVSGGFTLSEEHGLQADGTGRLQVPGLGRPSHSIPLFSFNPVKVSNFLVGNEQTCTAPGRDSCAGRPNGLYCSESTENSAYECRDGQIAGGQQCPSGQKCDGPLTNNTIKCKQ